MGRGSIEYFPSERTRFLVIKNFEVTKKNRINVNILVEILFSLGKLEGGFRGKCAEKISIGRREHRSGFVSDNFFISRSCVSSPS